MKLPVGKAALAWVWGTFLASVPENWGFRCCWCYHSKACPIWHAWMRMECVLGLITRAIGPRWYGHTVPILRTPASGLRVPSLRMVWTSVCDPPRQSKLPASLTSGSLLRCVAILHTELTRNCESLCSYMECSWSSPAVSDVWVRNV